jgi:PTH1 family peptidyl-tRNA hydrolase
MFDWLKQIQNDQPRPDTPVEAPGEPHILTGLGNPGREYKETRHNIGFMTLDRLAEKLDVTFSRVESKALVAKARYAGKQIILVKPQTYMNLSGTAVGALVKFYKVPVENVLVIYDDVDLPLGSLRIRPAGGSAGQKGMKSIMDRLTTEAVPRMRLGIGRPPGRMDAADYVLQTFHRDEQDILISVLDRAAQAALTFVTDGLTTAMNQYNGKSD